MRTYLITVVALLLVATRGYGQQAEVDPAIEDSLSASGTARVIIEFDSLSFSDPTASAMGNIAGALTANEKESATQIGTLPYIVSEIGPESLQRVLASGVVKRVVEDRPVPPLLAQTRAVVHADASLPVAGLRSRNPVGYSVAILDSGVDASHPFISSSVVREACFSTSRMSTNKYNVTSLCPNGLEVQTTTGAAGGCPQTNPRCWHGTHVAGIVAGRSGLGPDGDLAGIFPAAGIIAVQVFTLFEEPVLCASQGFSSPCIMSFLSDQLEALEYLRFLSREHKIAAVNMSLGERLKLGDDCNAYLLAPVIHDLFDRGIITVAASGNDASVQWIRAPACIKNVVAVGATDDLGEIATSFPGSPGQGTNSSPLLDILAPGVSVESASAQAQYAELSGTSQASPHVAAAIAALRSSNPELRPDVILSSLRSGRAVVDPRSGLSFPLLDLTTAVASLKQNGGSSPTGAAAESPTATSQPELPGPDVSRFIVKKSGDFTSEDVSTIRSILEGELGAENVDVFEQGAQDRVIVESDAPITSGTIESLGRGVGVIDAQRDSLSW